MDSPSDQRTFRSPFVLARLLQPKPPTHSKSTMASSANPATAYETATAMSSLSLQEDRPRSAPPEDNKNNSSVSNHPARVANGTPSSDAASTQGTKLQDSIFIKGQAVDDVFGNNTHLCPTSRHEPIDIADEPAIVTDDKLTTPASKHAPRADRIGSPITPANAQGVLPPEACVFVANLSMMRTDEQLEFSCHQAFDIFGNCVVKVRRDRHKHPYALVQYYNGEDASRAVQGAHDLLIDGRRIRTEPAKANRSLVLVKASGGSVSTDEARKALEQWGSLEKLYPTTHADARRFGCPEGMWVEFAYYLDYKDTVKNFNGTDELYRVHVPPENEPRFRADPTGNDTFQGFRSPRSSTDQKSIFLGNLPHDTDESELREIFAGYGDIKAINIIHKPVHGSGFNVFGFVEFATADEAERASRQEIDIRGQRIRVEPKEYSARRHTRLQQFSPSSNYSFGNRHGYPQINTPFGMYGNYSYYHGGQDHGMHHGMSPYYHNGYNVYQTPAPHNNRMVPRRHNMAFSAPSHGIPMFTPASLPPPQYNMNHSEDSTYGVYSMFQGDC